MKTIRWISATEYTARQASRNRKSYDYNDSYTYTGRYTGGEDTGGNKPVMIMTTGVHTISRATAPAVVLGFLG